jgi:hypothetical protein
MHTEITVFEKPIERIKKSCELVALALSSNASCRNSRRIWRSWWPKAKSAKTA